MPTVILPLWVFLLMCISVVWTLWIVAFVYSRIKKSRLVIKQGFDSAEIADKESSPNKDRHCSLIRNAIQKGK